MLLMASQNGNQYIDNRQQERSLGRKLVLFVLDRLGGYVTLAGMPPILGPWESSDLRAMCRPGVRLSVLYSCQMEARDSTGSRNPVAAKKSSPEGCIVLYRGYIAATSPTSPHSTTNHGCNTGALPPPTYPSDYLCELSVDNDHIYSCSDLGGFVCGRIGSCGAPALFGEVEICRHQHQREPGKDQDFRAFLFTFFLGCHKCDIQPDTIDLKSS